MLTFRKVSAVVMLQEARPGYPRGRETCGEVIAQRRAIIGITRKLKGVKKTREREVEHRGDGGEKKARLQKPRGI